MDGDYVASRRWSLMSAITWTRPAKSRRAPTPRDPKPPFSRTAPHIRGRVFAAGYRTRRGDQMWNMEVVNTRTGRVLIADNCADLSLLIQACNEATAAARATWFYGLRHKAVQ